MAAAEDVEHFLSEQIAIKRSPVAFSATDGTIICGFRYEREESGKFTRVGVPLLCLPSDTGNVREFHDFALAHVSDKRNTAPVIALDMRGRGRSGHADPQTYTPIHEANDVIAFCDANNLHKINVLVTAGSATTALLVAPVRPALIRSIIFNDGGPERDGVGIARTKAIYHQMPEPATWEDAVAILKQIKGKQFPVLTDQQWLSMAEMMWSMNDSAMQRDHDPVFAGIESRVDFDERQPTLWPELKMFHNKPVMVIRGENSLLLTEELVKRMKQAIPALDEVVAKGQGHSPMIGSYGLPTKISNFLARNES